MGTYANSYSREAVIRGAFLVNSGSGWHEAARSSGMSIDNLKKRAIREGIVLRSGRKSFSCEMRLVLPTNPVDLAYIAGILDGEGSVTIAKSPRIVVRVGITNVDLPLIKWLESIGGGVTKKKRVGKRKQCYHWQLYGRLDIKAFLEAIIPYMRIKKRKAQKAVDLIGSWVNVLEKTRLLPRNF